MKDLSRNVTLYCNVCGNDQFSALDDELERIRLEIIDIEHAAEFYDLDLYKGWKVYKMLQDARKRRRR